MESCVRAQLPAQLTLEYLPVGIARQGLDLFPTSWDLVARQRDAAVRFERGGVERRTVPGGGDDDGDDQLAPQVVGYTDHCDIGHVGGFVRYEFASGEISVTGGASSDKLRDGGSGLAMAQASAPFAMLSWLTRF